MVKAVRALARATRRHVCLPEEIVIWEILVRLPPKPLLRCRAVCRPWRCATSARDFLMDHQSRQPSLPVFWGDNQSILGIRYHNIPAFDHHAAMEEDQLHAVALLDKAFEVVASCDGPLVLSKPATTGSRYCLSICNPATREHALLGLPSGFGLMGMYLHRPTGEYRLLLQWSRFKEADLRSKYQIGCYVFSLGSDQPPRYIGWPETSSTIFSVPVRVRDSLHWYPVYSPREKNKSLYERKLVVVFDTIAESFRPMREPTVPDTSHIFDIDGTLGIYARHSSTEFIDIHVLQSYESEVWDLKHRIKLPVSKIRREFEDSECWEWDFHVVSVNGGMLVLVKIEGWLLHVDSDGKLVNSFYLRRRGLCTSDCRLKQSLVQHTFFPALEEYAVNDPPFIGPVK